MTVDLSTTLPRPEAARTRWSPPPRRSATSLDIAATRSRTPARRGRPALAVRGADRARGGRARTGCSSPAPSSFAEALTYFPELDDYHTGPATYLEHVAAAKEAARRSPSSRSLNGTSPGGWIRYAKLIAGRRRRRPRAEHLLRRRRPRHDRATRSRPATSTSCAPCARSISIPLAVKVGPYFSSIGATWRSGSPRPGADGLVLFNRFLQPDIDLETLDVVPRLTLSTPDELLLPLRWIAILHGRVARLAGGHHAASTRAEDVRQGPARRRRRGHDRLGALQRRARAAAASS